jgi:hypothetical protein
MRPGNQFAGATSETKSYRMKSKKGKQKKGNEIERNEANSNEMKDENKQTILTLIV